MNRFQGLDCMNIFESIGFYTFAISFIFCFTGGIIGIIAKVLTISSIILFIYGMSKNKYFKAIIQDIKDIYKKDELDSK